MTDTLRDRLGALVREKMAEWCDDARTIREACEDRKTANLPCDCCEWHATGLEQAATELEALAAQPAPAVMGEDCSRMKRKVDFKVGEIVTLFADVERDMGNGNYALKTDGGNHILESNRDMYEIERVAPRTAAAESWEEPREGPKCKECDTCLIYGAWLGRWYCPKCNVERDARQPGESPT